MTVVSKHQVNLGVFVYQVWFQSCHRINTEVRQ